jgi:DNA polymerase
MTVGKMRGRALELPDGTAGFITTHPSFLLRIIEHADKQSEYRRFVGDLRLAGAILAGS